MAQFSGTFFQMLYSEKYRLQQLFQQMMIRTQFMKVKNIPISQRKHCTCCMVGMVQMKTGY